MRSQEEGMKLQAGGIRNSAGQVLFSLAGGGGVSLVSLPSATSAGPHCTSMLERERFSGARVKLSFPPTLARRPPCTQNLTSHRGKDAQ